MKTFKEFVELDEARSAKDQGIFHMDITHKLDKDKIEIGAAKKMLQSIVDNNTRAESKNINAADAMIRGAKSVEDLRAGVVNFILKYQGLGV